MGPLLTAIAMGELLALESVNELATAALTGDVAAAVAGVGADEGFGWIMGVIVPISAAEEEAGECDSDGSRDVCDLLSAACEAAMMLFGLSLKMGGWR